MRTNSQFLRLLRHMGIDLDPRSTYRLYHEYFIRTRIKRIMKDIETSKKGPYYLMDYLMKQKQENIMTRIIRQNNRKLKR